MINNNFYSGIWTILGQTGSVFEIMNAGSKSSQSMKTAMSLGTEQNQNITDLTIKQILAHNQLRNSIQNYLELSLQQLKKYIINPEQMNLDKLPEDSWQRLALKLAETGDPVFLAANKQDIQNGKINLQIIREADFLVNINNQFSQELHKWSIPDYSEQQKKQLTLALKLLQPYYEKQKTIEIKKQLIQALTEAAGSVAILQSLVTDPEKNANAIAKVTKQSWQRDIQNALSSQHPFTITATVDGGIQVIDQFSTEYLIKLNESSYQDPVTRKIYTSEQRQMLIDAINLLQQEGLDNPLTLKKKKPAWLIQALNDQKAGIGFSIAINSLGRYSHIVVKEQDLATNLIGPGLKLTNEEKKPAPKRWMRTALLAYSDKQPYTLVINSGKIETLPLLNFDVNGHLNVQKLLNMICPEPNISYLTSVANLYIKDSVTSETMGFFPASELNSSTDILV